MLGFALHGHISVIKFCLPGDGYEAGCHRCHFLRETSVRVEMTFHNRPKDPVNGLVAWNGHIQDEEMPENIKDNVSCTGRFYLFSLSGISFLPPPG